MFDLFFLPLGGASEIGASCFYLNIDGTGILLDCGIHPRKSGFDSLPNFNLLKNHPVDAVFISHAHQDHIGALPYFVKQFPHVKIYSTVQTVEISMVTLNNAAKILKAQLSENNQDLLYTHDELELMLKSVRTFDYEEEISLRGLAHKNQNSISVTFHDAGHILGSSLIEIKYNGRIILYTGDIKLGSQSILKGAAVFGINADLLITESTYGYLEDTLIPNRLDEIKRFTWETNNVLNNGGSVLIPVFGLGKYQEMLSLIYSLMQKCKLVETTIYTGGIGRRISRIYDTNKYLVKRNYENLNLHDIPQENYLEIEDLSHFIRKPGIVLATSGMMIEGTASLRMAKFWLKQKKFAVWIVGYIDPESTGYPISAANKGDKIVVQNGTPVKVNCDVKKFHFPSHSSKTELLNFIDDLKPSKIILIHGDYESKDKFGYEILSRFPKVKLYNAENSNSISLNV
ncbi:MAG: MBL fold metallo-hydrolase [Bacteroidetes bacterium]|nr:MBL fold metallo-hydrolase [Bacteroidota bacterium]MBU2507094.1 MBL fold metallo-hydrolase [Bacteroidota bacterium]